MYILYWNIDTFHGRHSRLEPFTFELLVDFHVLYCCSKRSGGLYHTCSRICILKLGMVFCIFQNNECGRKGCVLWGLHTHVFFNAKHVRIYDFPHVAHVCCYLLTLAGRPISNTSHRCTLKNPLFLFVDFHHIFIWICIYCCSASRVIL